MPRFPTDFTTAHGGNVDGNTASVVSADQSVVRCVSHQNVSCNILSVFYIIINDDQRGISKLASKIVIHGLDFLLSLLILPYTTWNWISKSKHLAIMLRVILEVILELTIWLILGGVSILTVATLILDDLYSSQGCSEGSQRLANIYKINTENEDTKGAATPKSSSAVKTPARKHLN